MVKERAPSTDPISRPAGFNRPASLTAHTGSGFPGTYWGVLPEPVPSAPRAFYSNSTGTPFFSRLASSSASQLVSLTQPCEKVLSILLGAGVPWMP